MIEIDGSQHLDATEDKARDKYLEDRGLRVLRFFSNEVLTDLDAVVEVVYRTMKARCR